MKLIRCLFFLILSLLWQPKVQAQESPYIVTVSGYTYSTTYFLRREVGEMFDRWVLDNSLSRTQAENSGGAPLLTAIHRTRFTPQQFGQPWEIWDVIRFRLKFPQPWADYWASTESFSLWCHHKSRLLAYCVTNDSGVEYESQGLPRSIGTKTEIFPSGTQKRVTTSYCVVRFVNPDDRQSAEWFVDLRVAGRPGYETRSVEVGPGADLDWTPPLLGGFTVWYGVRGPIMRFVE